MMKLIGFFGALMFPVALMAATATATAPAPASRLDALLAQTKTLTAEFTETVVNANAVTVKQSSGKLAIAKPGRFRWDYQKPYRQIIVADGERLWIYDPALEQVTVRDQPQALASGPAALLAGTAQVETGFTVTDMDRKDGLEWLQLRPKSDDVSFTAIRIGLEPGKGIRVLELDSRLGQTTRIVFTDVQRNVEIDPDRFKFTPPAGADVVDQSAAATETGTP